MVMVVVSTRYSQAFYALDQYVVYYNGGEGGIRTHEGLAALLVFETSPFNHSGTSPLLTSQQLSAVGERLMGQFVTRLQP